MEQCVSSFTCFKSVSLSFDSLFHSFSLFIHRLYGHNTSITGVRFNVENSELQVLF